MGGKDCKWYKISVYIVWYNVCNTTDYTVKNGLLL